MIEKKNLTIVKVGGKIVEDHDTLQQLLLDFSSIEGPKILVHGGGRAATKLAERLNIPSKMVNGRRITDKETLEIVTMVYGGLVNKNIVAGLQAIGIDALGLTGADMNIIRSEKRPIKDIDYGYVGDVKEVNRKALEMLLNDSVIPVLAPLTHDGQGSILNTNADTIAAQTAQALSSKYNVNLIYCFEKKGVLMDENDDNSIICNLDQKLFNKYVQEGIITAGMLPKLENAFDSLKKGVRSVVITKASEIARNTGTRIEL